MNTRVLVLGCLIGLVVLSVGYEGFQTPPAAFGKTEPSRAEANADKGRLKVGVVSIQKIFQNSKKVARYRQESLSEQEKARARLEKLAREAATAEEGVKTLRPGSSDYLAQYNEWLRKQGDLRIEQELYKQKMTLKELKMTEEIYKDILRETTEVAKQKGLDLVFEKSEPDLPASSRTQLELTMGIHKLLYSGGCLDITDEVTTRMDAK